MTIVYSMKQFFKYSLLSIITFLIFLTIFRPFFVTVLFPPIVDKLYLSKTKEKNFLIQVENTKSDTIDPTSELIYQSFVTVDSPSVTLTTTDPRIVAMRNFLSARNSPMAPYADVFIIQADKTGLDWRLVASISGVESAFGRIIPEGTNNAWGWRGGPNGNWSRFPTWREGIETVTNGLAYGYGTNLTPIQIERSYCPPCYENPAHPWSGGVNQFMRELDYYLNSI